MSTERSIGLCFLKSPIALLSFVYGGYRVSSQGPSHLSLTHTPGSARCPRSESNPSPYLIFVRHWKAIVFGWSAATFEYCALGLDLFPAPSSSRWHLEPSIARLSTNGVFLQLVPMRRACLFFSLHYRLLCSFQGLSTSTLLLL